MPEAETEQPEEPSEDASWLQSHAYGLLTFGILMVAGTVGTVLVFPEVDLVKAVLGGSLLGIVCAFIVVMNRFIE